jgi:outer membrane protein TolC
LGSLFELEDARRTALSAQTAVLGLRQERANAWIALYRAAGGGWQAPGPTPQ